MAVDATPRLTHLPHRGARAAVTVAGTNVSGPAAQAGYGSGARRPLIFTDIDGVLIPLRARSTGTRRLTGGVAKVADAYGNPLLERLDPADGLRLLALPGELVWASTWMAEANDVVAPRLGLPVLPVVDWPDDDTEPQHRLHWKTVPLTRWATGRPYAWLEDEITDVDRHWVAAHHSQPALLHRVDPYLGLTDSDLAAVHQWLEQFDDDHRSAAR